VLPTFGCFIDNKSLPIILAQRPVGVLDITEQFLQRLGLPKKLSDGLSCLVQVLVPLLPRVNLFPELFLKIVFLYALSVSRCRCGKTVRFDTLWRMPPLRKEGRLPKIDEEGATGTFDNKGAIFVPGGMVYADVDEMPISYESC